jgi:hypothetical protein
VTLARLSVMALFTVEITVMSDVSLLDLVLHAIGEEKPAYASHFPLALRGGAFELRNSTIP